MDLPLYQIDAFADEPFTGNPAAVCPLPVWLDDQTMQSIALENNLSETAFFVGGDGAYGLRWFTPESEMNLCGHATLASAYVIFTHLEPAAEALTFSTKSGDLVVRRDGGRLVMDFPVAPGVPCATPNGLGEALGATVIEVLSAGRDLMVRLDSAATVRDLDPNLDFISHGIGHRCLIVTAPGDAGSGYDFVSRFFAPGEGISEDPVTGSAHCVLAPYWAGELGKNIFVARQLSARGGTVHCGLQGDRVMLSGNAIPYLQGTISI